VSASTLFRVFVFFAACLCSPGVIAGADEAVPFGPHDVHSAFFVSKSENQNQVHYGVRLDAQCRPQSKPVFGYWRRLRNGQRVDAPLTGPGRHLYGASDEQQVTATEYGGIVRMFVKAAKQVRITIRVEKTEGGCKATATTNIKGAPAKLDHAFLQLSRFGLSVKYVELVGTRLSDGAEVKEQIR
jgi:hypothetical protein